MFVGSFVFEKKSASDIGALDGDAEGDIVGGDSFVGFILNDGDTEGQGLVGGAFVGGSVGIPQLESQLGLVQYAGPAPQ